MMLFTMFDVIHDVNMINNTIIKRENNEWVKIYPVNMLRESKLNKLVRESLVN